MIPDIQTEGLNSDFTYAVVCQQFSVFKSKTDLLILLPRECLIISLAFSNSCLWPVCSQVANSYF